MRGGSPDGLRTVGSKNTSIVSNPKDIKINDPKGFNDISEIIQDGNDFISLQGKSRTSERQPSAYVQEINKVYP